MSDENAETSSETLAPDAAFAALADETRMAILRTLGAADGPLSFSDLRDRTGVRDSGRFNYHLDTVTGHFVERTEDGYRLRQAGARVVEAVLSGAVTDTPVVEPTRIEEACPLCGAPTLLAFRRGRVEHYCRECRGHYGESTPLDDATGGDDRTAYGFLGSFQLPPAGLRDRTPEEVFRAGATWGILEFVAVASDVCPRCSAPLERLTVVCERHDPEAGLCERCGNRHATQFTFDCTNCLYGGRAALAAALVTDSDLLAFLTDHGVDPLSSAPSAFVAALMDYDEELRSLDPVEVRVTFAVDGETLSLVVDGDAEVIGPP